MAELYLALTGDRAPVEVNDLQNYNSIEVFEPEGKEFEGGGSRARSVLTSIQSSRKPRVCGFAHLVWLRVRMAVRAKG